MPMTDRLRSIFSSPEGTTEPPGRGAAGYSPLSVLALIGANLIPLFGVLALGWRVFPILLLFSLENIVIGFYNVLRMVMAPCDLKELRASSKGIGTKGGLILFFCVHYGMFSAGHLFFIVSLFAVFGDSPATGPHWAEWSRGPDSRPWQAGGWWLATAVGGLFISHGVSYWKNFIQRGEYKRVTANRLFLGPYGRIMVMHVTVVGGAFAVLATGSHAAPLSLLVIGKIVLDVVAHVRERRKFAGQPARPRRA